MPPLLYFLLPVFRGPYVILEGLAYVIFDVVVWFSWPKCIIASVCEMAFFEACTAVSVVVVGNYMNQKRVYSPKSPLQHRLRLPIQCHHDDFERDSTDGRLGVQILPYRPNP